MAWMDRLRERIWGMAPWDAGKISDEWFRIHFEYAADVTHQWIGSVLDVKQSRLLQFGCGDSVTDLGIVLRHGARSIHCVDVMQGYRKLPEVALAQLGMARLPAALSYQTIQPGEVLAGQKPLYDGIMSWSVFEHVNREQVLPILRDLYQCLKPGGHFFLQIEPLYYSAYGSHLRRFSEVPWHHLLASEDELWAAVQAHRDAIKADEADLALEDLGMEKYKRYIFDEYLALNKLTADELVALVKQAGFAILREKRGDTEPTAPIPEALLQRYPREVLVNNEIFLLMQRPA
ncbi:class I SAM-dependent methyltransferase [Comamonas sp. JUb58]|uniref:class I SAM-dependent methyltransferase n=1 Tax=Comamonas sp. JUb58 TaxID=2485114 RepID=UPI00105E35E6|nr:class I SAM-dependent methyltransferase [Comamonas sp. JUb58]TDS83113.1 methyltransferase family protein [Comamonas sp. JUb58]